MTGGDAKELKHRVARDIALCWLLVSIAAGLLAWWAMGRADRLWWLGAAQFFVLAYAEVWALKHLTELRHLESGRPMPALGPANLLTFIRFFLVAPSALLILELGPETEGIKRGAVLLMLLIALLTDWLDGLIARRRDQASRFGTFLDPRADFFLQLILSAALAFRGLLPFWFALLVLARVILLSAGGYFVLSRGHAGRLSLSALKLGKASVAAIFITMALSTLFWVLTLEEAFNPWLTGLSLAASALLIAAMAEKVRLFIRLLR